ncbi:MAG: alpha-ketoglutarate-dependent dioxygenase AlkB [Myxococcales bacterium]|nr:alpha-ketoglutarate-dependent dioxygenase AlkB [Myxococcales bacterium]
MSLFATRGLLIDDKERGCWVSYDSAFLDRYESERWFERLAKELPFEAEAPVIFGKAIPVRRRSCAIGEPGVRYRYSGVERAAHPWPEGFGSLLERVNRAADANFNFALCNEYADGEVTLGWHADDEHDLVRDAPIASLSLGATRDFALRRGTSGKASVTVALESGSLLIMGGATQRCYQHRVPERVRCREKRVNLTFRVMK